MFRDFIQEWRGAAPLVEQDAAHHDASAHATEASKHADAHDQHATELHYDPAIPAIDKHDRAVQAAWTHGQAELAHLGAAKSQYTKGNEELANRHVDAAKKHRDQFGAWMGGAHEAHLSHREQEFIGHYPHRALHKEKWNNEHPYDFEKWTHKEAENATKHADGVQPWSPRHRDTHEKAAKHWGAASQASREAADVTGPGTEDHSYYSMRAHHANVRHLHHKTKAAL